MGGWLWLLSAPGNALIPLPPPIYPGLPFLDLGLERLFQCLDVGHALTVLALLLLERKVLVVARHESLLAEVMEAFRALLFPFKWESCYVSSAFAAKRLVVNGTTRA